MSGISDGATAPYDLGASFPVGEARNQRPGRTLLVTGPAAVTERAALRLLLAGHEDGEGIVPVSTDRPTEELRAEYSDRTGGHPGDRFAVIDITGQSADAASPDDLAALGRELNESITEIQADRVRVGVLSLSGMLDHLDRTDVFKFCHVVRDRIDDAGYLGIATLATDETDSATVSMLQEAFDGTIEVREDEKGELVRVVGLPDTPVTWHAWG
jgi:KaiC/GvpD/RAD55 family RecA-like ATPase